MLLRLFDDFWFGGWQPYRRLRGGRWQYNPMWGWMRDEKPKPYPDPEVEDYTMSASQGAQK